MLPMKYMVKHKQQIVICSIHDLDMVRSCCLALDQTTLMPAVQSSPHAPATLVMGMSRYATTSCLDSANTWCRRRQRFNAESDGEDYSESEKSRSARSTPERSSYEERQARSDSDDDSDDGGQFQVSFTKAPVS